MKAAMKDHGKQFYVILWLCTKIENYNRYGKLHNNIHISYHYKENASFYFLYPCLP